MFLLSKEMKTILQICKEYIHLKIIYVCLIEIGLRVWVVENLTHERLFTLYKVFSRSDC